MDHLLRTPTCEGDLGKVERASASRSRASNPLLFWSRSERTLCSLSGTSWELGIIFRTSPRSKMSKAYLLGAMHDGTIRRRTLRISQREKEYILSVQRLIVSLGGNAWIYREGQTRELFVVEFARSFLDSCVVRTRKEIIGYIRGYFDAEGDRKSTRLNSSHVRISYAVFCLKKK